MAQRVLRCVDRCIIAMLLIGVETRRTSVFAGQRGPYLQAKECDAQKIKTVEMESSSIQGGEFISTQIGSQGLFIAAEGPRLKPDDDMICLL